MIAKTKIIVVQFCKILFVNNIWHLMKKLLLATGVMAQLILYAQTPTYLAMFGSANVKCVTTNCEQAFVA